MVDWAHGYEGKVKEYTQNFDEGTSIKRTLRRRRRR
jgi:hypothetical protein